MALAAVRLFLFVGLATCNSISGPSNPLTDSLRQAHSTAIVTIHNERGFCLSTDGTLQWVRCSCSPSQLLQAPSDLTQSSILMTLDGQRCLTVVPEIWDLIELHPCIPAGKHFDVHQIAVTISASSGHLSSVMNLVLAWN
jgi:hypothetical protein